MNLIILCHLVSVFNLRFLCLYAAAEFIHGEEVHVDNARRAVHTRAAACITAEVRVFENVL